MINWINKILAKFTNYVLVLATNMHIDSEKSVQIYVPINVEMSDGLRAYITTMANRNVWYDAYLHDIISALTKENQTPYIGECIKECGELEKVYGNFILDMENYSTLYARGDGEQSSD